MQRSIGSLIGIGIVVFLLIAIPITLYLAQRQQTVKPKADTGTWVLCGNEGGACSFSAGTSYTVSYGENPTTANASYVQATVNDSNGNNISCSAGAFNSLPIPNAQCYFLASGGGITPPPPPPPGPPPPPPPSTGGIGQGGFCSKDTDCQSGLSCINQSCQLQVQICQTISCPVPESGTNIGCTYPNAVLTSCDPSKPPTCGNLVCPNSPPPPPSTGGVGQGGSCSKDTDCQSGLSCINQSCQLQVQACPHISCPVPETNIGCTYPNAVLTSCDPSKPPTCGNLVCPNSPPPPPASTGTWVRCAGEGGVCALPSGATSMSVRFGADPTSGTGATATHYTDPRTFTANVNCNNSVFGDPYPTITKHCDILSSGTGGVTPPPPPSTGGSLPTKYRVATSSDFSNAQVHNLSGLQDSLPWTITNTNSHTETVYVQFGNDAGWFSGVYNASVQYNASSTNPPPPPPATADSCTLMLNGQPLVNNQTVSNSFTLTANFTRVNPLSSVGIHAINPLIPNPGNYITIPQPTISGNTASVNIANFVQLFDGTVGYFDCTVGTGVTYQNAQIIKVTTQGIPGGQACSVNVSASPSTLSLGQTTTVSWSSSNATSLQAVGGYGWTPGLGQTTTLASSGQKTTNPLTTPGTYVFSAKCTGTDGIVRVGDATVNVGGTNTTNACTPSTSGDVNKDGSVNGIDFTLWSQEALGIKNTKTADFNCDSKVDNNDYFIFKVAYLAAHH